jgi:RiboL-PSP-HEPN
VDDEMASTWPPVNLLRLKSALDQLADAVANRPPHRTDDEQIWSTRFLLLRICGYLEQVTHETSRSYVLAKSGGLVRSFAMSWLGKSRNPSTENLLDLIGRFDGALVDDLASLLNADDQRLHRELSLLVDRRHKIAHGLNEGITESKALSLKADAETIADWFFRNLKPDR